MTIVTMNKVFFMRKFALYLIRLSVILICLILFVTIADKGSRRLEFNEPKNGIVPDEATAIKIAEIIGNLVFGKNLKDYKPLHAELKNDSVWEVYGIPKKQLFAVRFGGCPVWEIKKRNGQILRVYLSR